VNGMRKSVGNKEVLGRNNRLLSFSLTRIASKTTRPTSLLLRIRYSGSVSTEPLPSNDKRHTHTHRMMGGIYEVR
jgi:hypothetical protein